MASVVVGWNEIDDAEGDEIPVPGTCFDENLATEFEVVSFVMIIDEFFRECSGCESDGDLAIDDESSIFFFVILHCSLEPGRTKY